MIQKANNYSTLNYIIVTLLIIVTDSPFFLLNKNLKFVFLLFLTLVFFLKKGNKKLDTGFIVAAGAATLMIIIQGFIWNFKLFTMFSYVGLTLFLPYLAYKIVGLKYLKIGARIIYFIAVYTSIIWLAQNLISPFDHFLQDMAKLVFPYTSDYFPRSILVYTVGSYDWSYMLEFGLYRNSGIFHEPGAYAVFLDFAIVINLLQSKILFSKKNIFLMFVVLSTFSTAGYFALFLIIFFYYFNVKWTINPFVRIFTGIVLIAFFVVVSEKVDFLGNKVQNQWEQETTRSLKKSSSGRIFGARKALLVLKRYPLTGKGLISATRNTKENVEENAKYGFMYLFSRIGIVLSVLFIIYYMRGLKRISIYFTDSTMYWQIILYSLLVNLFSQKFISDPFFIILLFIGIPKAIDFNKLVFNEQTRNGSVKKLVTIN